MTALQQGMVYHCELTGDPAMYHNVTAHRIAAPLDAVALRRALAGLVAAHPVLRTTFALGAYSEPLQLVHADAPVEVPVTDLADVDPQTRRTRIDDLVAQERVRPFDWARPPLLRLHAVREDADAFTLIVAEYHGILDGWSLHLFLTDLLAAYDRERAGTAGPARPGLPFREYVAAERRALADPVTRRFWLDGPGAMPPLRLGGPDPRTTTTQRVPLNAGTTEAVSEAARTAGVPVKSWLLAIHLRLVGELSGRDDVVSGLVVGGRPEGDGSDATLGLFLNTLPVSVALGTRSLTELAGDVWRAERELMGHHRFPLAEIVRAGGAGPRFDHFFNWTHFPNGPADGGSRIVDSRGVTVDVAFSLAVDAELDGRHRPPRPHRPVRPPARRRGPGGRLRRRLPPAAGGRPDRAAAGRDHRRAGGRRRHAGPVGGPVSAGVVVGSAELVERVWRTAIVTGSTLGPVDAWLLLRGIRTLPLRVERHNANALALAQALQGHPAVARVRYPGLPSHPQQELARRQMTGFGGVLSVELKAGRAGVAALLAGLRLAKRAASLGSVSTLVVHPRSMWAGIVDAEQLAASGIGDGLVRVSTGIEDTADLVHDFLAALDNAADQG